MVNKYGFKDAAPVKTPLDTKIKLAKQGDYIANTKFRKEYQSKVGSLNFSSNQTRPDIAFATGYVARYASNPNRAHMDAVDRIFTYLKSDPRKGIVYSEETATLPDVRTRASQQLDGCSRLLEGPYRGHLRDKKQWLHRPWTRSTLHARRLRRKLCGFATLSMTSASPESMSIKFPFISTITQP
jgi:hypothetical protein